MYVPGTLKLPIKVVTAALCGSGKDLCHRVSIPATSARRGHESCIVHLYILINIILMGYKPEFFGLARRLFRSLEKSK